MLNKKKVVNLSRFSLNGNIAKTERNIMDNTEIIKEAISIIKLGVEFYEKNRNDILDKKISFPISNDIFNQDAKEILAMLESYNLTKDFVQETGSEEERKAFTIALDKVAKLIKDDFNDVIEDIGIALLSQKDKQISDEERKKIKNMIASIAAEY